MVNERKLSGDKGGKRDPLSYLMGANEEFLVDGEQGLSEEELFGTELRHVLQARLAESLLSSEHIHVLHCRKGGGDCLTIVDEVLITMR